MGLEAPLAGRVPDDHCRRRRRAVVPAPGARRRPGDHHPHDDRRGGLAGRHGRGDAEAGHRAARAHAAGDHAPRHGAQLHDGGPDDDLRRPHAIGAAGGDRRRLVPGAQEHRRHARDAAAGRARAVLQRRLRRHVRHHLRVHRRRVHLQGTAQLRGGRALAAAARPGRVEDRRAGRAGRADLHRVRHAEARGAAPRLREHPRDAAGAEPDPAGRRDPDGAGTRVPARDGRLRVRTRHRGDQLRGRRPDLSPGRHRHRAPRLRRSAAADVPRQRQAGDRPRDRDARRGRHPDARRQRPQGGRRHPEQPPAGHRNHAGGRPGGVRRRRDQRLHGIAVAGDPDHPRLQLREPRRATRARWWRWQSRSRSPSCSRSWTSRTSTCTASRWAR